jgi:hypothetical protein
MAKRPIDPRTTYLRARAQVVGYPEPVLEVIRDLVREIQADPKAALGTGLMMDVLREQFALPGTGGRPSGLYGALADLVIVVAGVEVDKGAEQ